MHSIYSPSLSLQEVIQGLLHNTKVVPGEIPALTPIIVSLHTGRLLPSPEGEGRIQIIRIPDFPWGEGKTSTEAAI